jgi:hypothetical protein
VPPPVLQKHLLSRHSPLPEQSLGQAPPGNPGSLHLVLLHVMMVFFCGFWHMSL